jgi:hypothetical protein
MQSGSDFAWGSGCGGTNDDQGAIVVRLGGVAAEFVGRIQDGGGNGVGGSAGREFTEERGEPLEAELFGVCIGGFEDAIGSKNENIVELEMQGDGVVLNAFEHA